MKTIFVLFLFFLSTLLCAEESKIQLEKLRAEIAKTQELLRFKENEKTDLAFAVKQSNAAQKKIEQTLRNLRAQKQQVLRNIDQLNQNIAQGKTRYEQAKKELSALFYAQYLAGQPNYLALILKGKSPNSAKRNHFYWQHLNQARKENLDTLKKDIVQQELWMNDLAKEQERLATLEKTTTEKQAQLKAQQEEKSALLVAIQKEVLNHQERIVMLEKDAQNLSVLVDKLQQFSLTQNTPFQKGALIWPIPNAPRQKSGNGVFLKAQVGNAILSVANGRVVFADWLRGFGLLVIVDHGASYLSIYAHNDEITKKIGDWVQQGDILATSGQNVENAQSGVYFEIRHQGKPLDPFLWVEKK